MKYLLDTNTCIRFLKGMSENVERKIESSDPDDIMVCSIVKSELFYGAMKSNNVEKTLATQKQFLATYDSLDFDDAAAEICGQIRATLAKRGTPIGPYDLQIAATALANKLILVTHNVAEFSRVPNLKIEDWEV